MESLRAWLGTAGLAILGVLLAAAVAGALLSWARKRWAEAGEARERRRKERAAHHYAMGLASIVSGHTDLAIRELHRMLETERQSPGAYALLGDLYREKGRVELAIRLHATLLKRHDLPRGDRLLALSSLGKDYAKAGFVESARRTFEEAMALDRESPTPLVYLEKLAELTGAWEQAIALQEKLLALRPDEDGLRVLGCLHWQVGEERRAAGDREGALAAYRRAIETHARVAPAYISIGDLYRETGEGARAVQAWLELVEAEPRRAHLVLERLDACWSESGEPERAARLAAGLLERDAREWHAALFLARRALSRGKAEEAISWLQRAAERNPRSVEAHGLAWILTLPKDAPAPVRELRARFQLGGAFEEPFVCVACRYRTTDVLWRCPHCHRWDTFAGEHG